MSLNNVEVRNEDHILRLKCNLYTVINTVYIQLNRTFCINLQRPSPPPPQALETKANASLASTKRPAIVGRICPRTSASQTSAPTPTPTHGQQFPWTVATFKFILLFLNISMAKKTHKKQKKYFVNCYFKSFFLIVSFTYAAYSLVLV